MNLFLLQGGLFDDLEPKKSAAKKAPVVAKQPSPAPAKRAPAAVDSNVSKPSTVTAKPDKKKPAGGVSIFGGEYSPFLSAPDCSRSIVNWTISRGLNFNFVVYDYTLNVHVEL